ncbi:DoxX [Pigmentiphaga humi]|uniref:DoxX n=1 Tax=Pigmentiphaga humi TaxID=2478468 RepID=A0A3P4AY06_9BURK|nr:DoxX family protein [Pigmentiphaga humi]VCU68441.1 DoxX [Pigmentiphaga humi]
MPTPSNDFFATWTPRAQGLMRIIVAYLFVQHGTAKYFNIPALGFDNLPPLMMVAGVIEIVGGVLVLIGLFTRPAAFILSGFAAAAYFIAHAPKVFLSPLQNGGEAAVLYCFVFLFFAVAGAGAFSVDAIRRKA